MTITHVNIPKGQVLSQSDISKLIDRSKKNDLFAFFSGFDLDPAVAHEMYQDIFNGMNPDTVIWGSKDVSGRLSEDTFQSTMLHEIKKTYDRRFEGTTAKAGLTSINASVFIPTLIAPDVVDIVAKKTPFYAMVPKKPMTSSSMDILRRATDQISSIDFTTDTAATLSPLNQAYTKISITAKLLFVAGQVSHFAQVATQETADLYAKEIQDHFIDMQGFKEKAIITGEKTADGAYAGHFTIANGYDGIIKRIEDGASDNFNELSSQSINLGHVDQMAEDIFANNGEPSAIICDRSTFTRLRSLAKDFKKYEENDINLGYPDQRFSIDGIPVFPSNFMSRTANEKAMFMFDIGAVEYRELLPDTLFEVAQDMSPSKKFFFEHFGTFVVTAPEQCAAYVNGA